MALFRRLLVQRSAFGGRKRLGVRGCFFGWNEKTELHPESRVFSISQTLFNLRLSYRSADGAFPLETPKVIKLQGFTFIRPVSV